MYDDGHSASSLEATERVANSSSSSIGKLGSIFGRIEIPHQHATRVALVLNF